MDPFSIAALVAMIGGSAIQYKASTDAQQRQQEAIQRSVQNQAKLQREAEQKAMDTAKTFAPEDRQAEQAKIADTVTQELIAPVSESQTIRAGQQATQGDVSTDYSTAKAKSDVATLKNTQALARLLGKTTSAGRLRMNEGIRMMDAGQNINQLRDFSRGQAGADQIGIQQAGQVDPGMALAGSLMSAAGSAGMMSAGGGAVSAADLSAANASADPLAALNASKGWTGANPGLFAATRNNFNGMFQR